MKCNATNLTLSIITLCMLSCSDQPKVPLVEKSYEQVTTKEESLTAGKWLVLHDVCNDTFDLNGLEAITIDEQTLKMGNQNFTNGTWETAQEHDSADIVSFIDSELGCINQKSDGFQIKTYSVNKQSILFAISKNKHLIIRKVADRFSVATTYSEQEINKALLETPFEDEPLPYNPFSIDEEITGKTES